MALRWIHSETSSAVCAALQSVSAGDGAPTVRRDVTAGVQRQRRRPGAAAGAVLSPEPGYAGVTGDARRSSLIVQISADICLMPAPTCMFQCDTCWLAGWLA